MSRAKQSNTVHPNFYGFWVRMPLKYILNRREGAGGVDGGEEGAQCLLRSALVCLELSVGLV